MRSVPTIRYRTLPLALAGLLLCLAPAAARADEPRLAPAAVAPPPEIALVVPPADARNLAIARVGAWAGTAGGIALTVWGLGSMANTIAADANPGALHEGAALVISGSVLAAICSSIIGILQGQDPSASFR